MLPISGVPFKLVGDAMTRGRIESPDMASRVLMDLGNNSTKLIRDLDKHEWTDKDETALIKLIDSSSQVMGLPGISFALDIGRMAKGTGELLSGETEQPVTKPASKEEMQQQKKERRKIPVPKSRRH